MKYAKEGDIIVHLGPGASNSYQQVKDKLIKGLKEGSKRYAKKRLIQIQTQQLLWSSICINGKFHYGFFL